MPKNSFETARAERKAFDMKAKELGHILTISSIAMSDSGSCSCGWKSKGYFDGCEYIYNDWCTHVRKASGNGQVVMNFG